MIPTRDICFSLWDTYNLPEKKRHHSQLVSELALFFTDQLNAKHPELEINRTLVEASALLHDIDKAIPRLEGETHPQTGVRILRSLNYSEVSDIIKHHSVTAILQEETKPKRWEEKVLFLADKMVKNAIISVDDRFALWFTEADLPDKQKMLLRKCLPVVHSLEIEISQLLSVAPEHLVTYCKESLP